jgi:hypothetical protein
MPERQEQDGVDVRMNIGKLLDLEMVRQQHRYQRLDRADNVVTELPFDPVVIGGPFAKQ